MNEKEKAIELVDRFKNYALSVEIEEEDLEFEDLKQSALIAVNYAMEMIPPNIDPLIYMPLLSELHQIKTEIEKL